MRRIYVLMCAIVLTGCAPAAGGPTSASPSATVGGATLEGVLAGDADLEGGCAWLDTGGRRMEVLWPAGYRVTAPPVELRDPTGAVVAGDGDRLRVRGNPAADQVSTCQVGELWDAVDVEPVR